MNADFTCATCLTKYEKINGSCYIPKCENENENGCINCMSGYVLND